MRIVLPQQPRGIALIMVMVVIVTFMLLAGLFASNMTVETRLARNASMDSDMEWLGRSGIELAKYVLSQPKQGGMQYDALNQKWAGGTGETNLMEISLDNYELGRGSFSVKIEDLDRKFNVNSLVQGNVVNPNALQLMQQASILVGIDAAQSSQIINGIIDWLDFDDATHVGSTETETSYYMQLNPPYRAKNGPIDDITELMLIHGITPAMFYGPHADPMAAVRTSQLGPSAFDEPTYPVGLVDLLTTISAGPININTASRTALQLVPEVDDNIASAIISARAGPDGVEGNEDDMPFRSIQDLARVPGLPPQLLPRLAQFFNVMSSTFEVHVEARIDNYKREYVAVLRRDGNRVVTLFMYWK